MNVHPCVFVDKSLPNPGATHNTKHWPGTRERSKGDQMVTERVVSAIWPSEVPDLGGPLNRSIGLFAEQLIKLASQCLHKLLYYPACNRSCPDSVTDVWPTPGKWKILLLITFVLIMTSTRSLCTWFIYIFALHSLAA